MSCVIILAVSMPEARPDAVKAGPEDEDTEDIKKLS
jgi:hypothetical protein